MHEETLNELGSVAPRRRGVVGRLAAGGGAAWPASSSAEGAPSRAAARRADAPHPAAPRTRRNAPGMCCAGRADRAGGDAPDAPVAGRKVTDTGPERRALSVSGPSTRKGTRRSFLTASQKPLRRKHLRDPPLRAETSADPAGLTARARPKARPCTRAARPQSSTTERYSATMSGEAVICGPGTVITVTWMDGKVQVHRYNQEPSS